MQKIFLQYFKKKLDILILFSVILFTVLITSNFNIKKKKSDENLLELYNNVFFKKTLDHVFSGLEKKLKRINHKVVPGENFNNILNNYSIQQTDIDKVKSILSKNINLNNLNPNLIIEMVVDQSLKELIELNYPLSKTKRINITKINNNFSENIISSKLNKELLYRENIILNSLYAAAIKENIPVNTIIEFAGIYGFLVDCQRDIKMLDEVLYEETKKTH